VDVSNVYYSFWLELRNILTIIKVGELPKGNLYISVFISFGEKHLGGSVTGSGIDKNWLISSSLREESEFVLG